MIIYCKKKIPNNSVLKGEYQEHKNIKIEIDEKDLYELDKFIFDEIHLEWHKCTFEIELKNIYNMNIFNDINIVHDNEVNNIYEWNLLHGILNHSKCTKIQIAILPLFYMVVWIHVQVK